MCLWRFFFVLSAVTLGTGLATSSIPTESGFLPDYSRLQQEAGPGGGRRLAYVNPAFTPARYNAIKLDPVVYYPEPRPTEGISMETLTQIRNALDQSLRKKLGQKIRLVDQAGPGVAHEIGRASGRERVCQYV